MGQRQSTPQNSNDNNSSSSNRNVNSNRRGRVARPSSRSTLDIPPHDNIPYRRTTNNVGRSNQRSSSSTQQHSELDQASATATANEQREWRRLRRERLREASDNDNTNDTNQQLNQIISTVSEAIDAAAALNNINNSSHSRGTNHPAHMTTAATAASDSTSATTRTTTEATMSPFSSMLAQVLTEAVVTSFRNGMLTATPPFPPTQQQQQPSQHDSNSNSDSTSANSSSNENDQSGSSSSNSRSSNTRDNMDIDPPTATASQPTSNTRQQLTMHISPEMFRQMEPEGTEDTFMRYLRLPVFVSNTPMASATTSGDSQDASEPLISTTTGSRLRSSSRNTTSTAASTSSTAVNADGEAPTLTADNSSITHIMMLPVFLYGMRTNINDNDNGTTTTAAEDSNRRFSRRIREREEREQQAREEETAAAAEATAAGPSSDNNQRRSRAGHRSNAGGQWTLYIISGTSVENLFTSADGDRNFSYEELLELAAMIGPARRPTVSQEEIDAAIPIVKYTRQVKQMMVGNAEGCQVCLNSYQSEDDIRVLSCHHGFHKDCIDKWLTEGQNQCPLCRGVPVQRRTEEEDSSQRRT